MEIQVGAPLTVDQAFALAIAEAKKGLGFVEPNPPVGCVILDKNGGFVSKGHHQKFGKEHAEVNAIHGVKDLSLLEGAQVIVTLEPCSHFGKTPPCADLLTKHPISKVHYGILDPNPKVSGQGIEKLEAAGIKTQKAPKEISEQIEGLMEIFLVNMKLSEPFIALKIASSLDGQMALKNGQSQWITSEKAREHGQRLRARYGCVLTGAQTILADDPQFNCRVEPFIDKQIPVVILDRSGECAQFIRSSKLLKVRAANSIYIFTNAESGSKFDSGLGLNLLAVDEVNGHLNLKSALQILWSEGIHSILVEGGPNLVNAFLNETLFHRLYLFLGNRILGQKQDQGWSKGLEVLSLDQALSLDQLEMNQFEDSVLISGKNPNFHSPVLR